MTSLSHCCPPPTCNEEVAVCVENVVGSSNGVDVTLVEGVGVGLVVTCNNHLQQQQQQQQLIVSNGIDVTLFESTGICRVVATVPRSPAAAALLMSFNGWIVDGGGLGCDVVLGVARNCSINISATTKPQGFSCVWIWSGLACLAH